MRLIFPGKNGRVTFLHLLSSNTVPSFGKIQCREVSELLWTDGRTDGLLSQVLAQLKLRTKVENCSVPSSLVSTSDWLICLNCFHMYMIPIASVTDRRTYSNRLISKDLQSCLSPPPFLFIFFSSQKVNLLAVLIERSIINTFTTWKSSKEREDM